MHYSCLWVKTDGVLSRFGETAPRRFATASARRPACPGPSPPAAAQALRRAPQGRASSFAWVGETGSRILVEAAQAALKKKGSHFQNVFADLYPRWDTRGHLGPSHRQAAVEDLARGGRLPGAGPGDPFQSQEAPRAKAGAVLRKLEYGVILADTHPGHVAEDSAAFNETIGQRGDFQSGPCA